jgi:hypothetical protein
LVLGVLTAAVAYAVRWGLLEVGAGPLVVLGVTGLVSLVAVGGLCLIEPAIMGEYGQSAARHFLSAVGSRLHPYRAP